MTKGTPKECKRHWLLGSWIQNSTVWPCLLSLVLETQTPGPCLHSGATDSFYISVKLYQKAMNISSNINEMDIPCFEISPFWSQYSQRVLTPLSFSVIPFNTVAIHSNCQCCPKTQAWKKCSNNDALVLITSFSA